ncbi:hypothetical protein D1007_28524 [Hordeum vulgare]|nr:hypothetical protein D1007_28524 [Hordeum vulgare]
MDLVLKVYLDKLTDTLTKANDDTRADLKGIKAQLDTQTTQVEALTTLRLDLKERFTKMEEAVTALQGAPLPQTVASHGGSQAPEPFNPAIHGKIHGPNGHGVFHKQSNAFVAMLLRIITAMMASIYPCPS